MKTKWKVALGIAIPVIAGGALFFANEANYFPRATFPVRSFTDAQKIWSTGNNYLCAKTKEGIRCATLGVLPGGVENSIDIAFLSDPVSIVEDSPHVCALEHGEILCWNMGGPILGGLGLVYTPAQEQAGTIHHGSLPRTAASKLPSTGEVRALERYRSVLCVLDGDGATCFKYADAKAPAPSPVWHHAAHRMMLAAANDYLCIDDEGALVCFEGGMDATPLLPRVRIEGAGDATAIGIAYGSVCVLGSAGVSCGDRPYSRDEHALDQVKVGPAPALGKPTRMWTTSFDFFAQEGTNIVTWSARGVPTAKTWGTLGANDAVFLDGPEWFVYRGGTLLRSPNYPWPRRYSIGSPPSQLVSASSEDCVLAGGRVTCFDY